MILRNINGVNLCLRNEKVTGIRDQECKSNICCTCTFALWILLLGKGSPKELVMELTDIRQLFCRVIFFPIFERIIH